MYSFSRLRHLPITCADGAHAHLADLVVELRDDYPLVTHLVVRGVRGESGSHLVPWDCVTEHSQSTGALEVKDFSEAVAPDADWNTRIVLGRDVLDALIIDLPGREVTRANDLWLKFEGAQLFLHAADAGITAIFRRLTRGKVFAKPTKHVIDWRYVEFLRGDLDDLDLESGYQRRIGRLPSGAIARISDYLPYLHAAELLALLPPHQAADTLEALTCERQVQVFEEFPQKLGRIILAEMAPELAADLMGRLDAPVAQKLLNAIPRAKAEQIVELLRYPENTVGGIMTNDVVVLEAAITVKQALEQLHHKLAGPDFVYFIYAVANLHSRQVVGMTTLRELLTAKPDQLLQDLMETYVLTLQALAPAREGAFEVLNCGLAALPVVGHEGRLLGVVTVDAAVAEVAPPSWSAQAPRIFS